MRRLWNNKSTALIMLNAVRPQRARRMDAWYRPNIFVDTPSPLNTFVLPQCIG